MDGRESGGIGQLGLGNWEIEDKIESAARWRDSSNSHLTKEVSNPLPGRALTDVEHPFGQDRGIDHAVAPEGFGQGRIASGHGSNGDMRNANDGGLRERLQR